MSTEFFDWFERHGRMKDYVIKMKIKIDLKVYTTEKEECSF